MVYSILTLSREYSKAIHCTPLLSCLTTSGVVAGIGPGAALGLIEAPPGPGFVPEEGVEGEALWSGVWAIFAVDEVFGATCWW